MPRSGRTRTGTDGTGPDDQSRLATWIASVRTTRDRWIAFPPLDGGTRWKTLDDVELVLVAAVDEEIGEMVDACAGRRRISVKDGLTKFGIGEAGVDARLRLTFYLAERSAAPGDAR